MAYVNTKIFCSLWEGVEVEEEEGDLSLCVCVKDLIFLWPHTLTDFMLPVLSGRSFNVLSFSRRLVNSLGFCQKKKKNYINDSKHGTLTKTKNIKKKITSFLVAKLSCVVKDRRSC